MISYVFGVIAGLLLIAAIRSAVVAAGVKRELRQRHWRDAIDAKREAEDELRKYLVRSQSEGDLDGYTVVRLVSNLIQQTIEFERLDYPQ